MLSSAMLSDDMQVADWARNLRVMRAPIITLSRQKKEDVLLT